MSDECNGQRKEYNILAITYPIICIYHRLQSSNGNKTQLSWDLYEATDRMWWYDHFRHTTIEKYDDSEKGWYIQYDDNNEMS